MTKRTPLSAQKNIWFNSQQVDNSDLLLEQQYNDAVQSSIINNHIGNGVLPEVLLQNILFDSRLTTGFLDGKAISVQNQPADANFGNQLEISLAHSSVGGKKAIKIAIIGLDFQNNLQYEVFQFKKNEIQIGRKHFTQILTIIFNDFFGDPDLSFNLGGEILIREAQPLTLSRSPIMIAQDNQPNLFFRDLFLDGAASLSSFLQNALPLYNIDALGITIAELDSKILLSGDVTTQIGEKFIATTNNIQKITLLLSVRNLVAGQETNLVWNGDLVISVYPLQSDISCASDIAPNLPIDFSPSSIPLAQISVNYVALQNNGVVLDSIPQPVDFIFSNSPIASGNILVPGTFYVISIKRSGTADNCDLILSVGAATVPNSRITIFTGNLWVDILDQQLWFKIWTDAAKVSDGQAYESGYGITVPKTTLEEFSQSTVDYSNEALQFAGNDVFKAVVSASNNETVPIPDQRTGNPILSRQQLVPSIKLLNSIDIGNLEAAAEPLIIGAITDKNVKFLDATALTIGANLHSATLIKDELIIKIITDETDTTRFDDAVKELKNNLLNGYFEGAKISLDIPDGYSYRIASSRLCPMILGDVDGDGLITDEDLILLHQLAGYDLTKGLPLNTQFSTIGNTSTVNNGYNFHVSPLVYPVSNQSSIQFQIIRKTDGYIMAQGTDGIFIVNPADPAQANFTSTAIVFDTISNIDNCKLMIITPGVVEDYGSFNIIGNDVLSNVLTVRKILLSSEVVSQLLRADIDGDFHITELSDGYLLEQYINRSLINTPPTPPFPAPTGNAYARIGKTFEVIIFKLEQFIDRRDDYSSDPPNRSVTCHPTPDIFINNNSYYASHNFSTSPTPIIIEKKLIWDESLIVTNSHPKMVPSIFTSSNGFTPNLCKLENLPCAIYASRPAFDPGTVDYFIPNNMIIGDSGELKRPDGEFYKVDFEVGTIVLEIPDGLFGSEGVINILDDLISNYEGTGVTRLGFPAMKFADCSFVTPDSLSKDQLRFSVSVQSFSPNTMGLSDDGYSGVIVDGKMGVSIDYNTGLLKLNFTNLFQDAVVQTLSTKVQINVFMKKGGFNNRHLFVDSNKMHNMLDLVSVFSGANTTNVSAPTDILKEFEISLVSGRLETWANGNSPIIVSRKKIDFTKYPEVINGLTRHIQFWTCIQKNPDKSVMQIRILDETNSIYISNAVLDDNTGTFDPVYLESSDLIVGSVNGNLRSDMNAEYALEVSFADGSDANTSFVWSADLVIFYD